MPKPDSALSIRENVPLAPFTTLDVGGSARFLARAKHEEQILKGLDFARSRGCPVFILGGGSNVLVSDSGFPGLVIKIELTGVQPLAGDDGEIISAAAGEDWDAFVKRCISQKLAGIECLSGIPGTVGGTPVQNVGAYGEQVSDVILSVRVLDRETNDIMELSSAECRFAERCSIFNTTQKDRYIILRVAFALRAYDRPRIQHQELQNFFSANKRSPGLSEVRDAVLEIREAKGMILREKDPDSRSAGSFFRNPVLDVAAVADVEQRARELGQRQASENMPHFPASPGREKISAAWLIERAGFQRGYVFGKAGISSKHALALINRGGAAAQDIFDLMRLIQAKVYAVFGIELQPEPVFVGFH
jgi:UDP-N-acetylmuramate dehydrogenase